MSRSNRIDSSSITVGLAVGIADHPVRVIGQARLVEDRDVYQQLEFLVEMSQSQMRLM
jgi:hypothetical protein